MDVPTMSSLYTGKNPASFPRDLKELCVVSKELTREVFFESNFMESVACLGDLFDHVVKVHDPCKRIGLPRSDEAKALVLNWWNVVALKVGDVVMSTPSGSWSRTQAMVDVIFERTKWLTLECSLAFSVRAGGRIDPILREAVDGGRIREVVLAAMRRPEASDTILERAVLVLIERGSLRDAGKIIPLITERRRGSVQALFESAVSGAKHRGDREDAFAVVIAKL